MKFRKLLALALTGVTLLSTVPVQAQTTNSIGYTNFLFPEDGNNYFINAEHKFLGNSAIYTYDEETDKHLSFASSITNQEVVLPTNTYISFDITSLMYDFALEDKELKGLEYRDYKAITELVDYNNDFFFSKYDEILSTAFSSDEDIQASETATVTFTQDGKQLAKFTLNKNVLADNKHFSFYNKSTSPVKVTVDTDSWFAMDLGYTAHKANKKYISNSNWTFSTQKEKTFIAKVTPDVEYPYYYENIYGIIDYISVDNKPATIRIYQKGKLIQTKTVKSNTSFTTKKIKKGKYTIKVSTKSSGYNLLADDVFNRNYTNYNKKSSLALADTPRVLDNHFFKNKGYVFINVVPTYGSIRYMLDYRIFTAWDKASTPFYDSGVSRSCSLLALAYDDNTNGYGIGVNGKSLANLNFDRLSW